jgi:hypothetical protein
MVPPGSVGGTLTPRAKPGDDAAERLGDARHNAGEQQHFAPHRRGQIACPQSRSDRLTLTWNSEDNERVRACQSSFGTSQMIFPVPGGSIIGWFAGSAGIRPAVRIKRIEG